MTCVAVVLLLIVGGLGIHPLSGSTRIVSSPVNPPAHQLSACSGADCQTAVNLNLSSGGSPTVQSNASPNEPPPGAPGATYTLVPNSTVTNATAPRDFLDPTPQGGSASPAAPIHADARPATMWNTHYYYAGLYGGTDYSGNTVRLMYTSLWIPSSPTNVGDVYIETLNAFDTAGYYDQVGITSYTNGTGTNPNSTWAITWDQVNYQGGSAGCGNTAIAKATWYQGLTQWSWYTFFMYLSGTHLEFRVYNGSQSMNGTPLYANNSGVSDSASGFYTTSTTPCNGKNYYGMTVYQEVHHLATGLSMPTDDFFFGYTTIAWWSGSAWVYAGIPNSAFSTTCQETSCPIPEWNYETLYYGGSSGRIFEIVNIPFRIYFTYDTGSIATNSPFHVQGTEASQGPYCNYGTGYCPTTTSCYFPNSGTNWAGSCATGTGVPEPIYYNTTSTSATGTFHGVIQLTMTDNTPYPWSFFYFYITVW
jgi:hypothetical protein